MPSQRLPQELKTQHPFVDCKINKKKNTFDVEQDLMSSGNEVTDFTASPVSAMETVGELMQVLHRFSSRPPLQSERWEERFLLNSELLS